MKRRLGFIPCVLLLLASCLTPACNRRRVANGPTANEQKAFAGTVVGTYGVKADPSLTAYSPSPSIKLSRDGTFAMASIPVEWLSGYADPSEKTISVKGTWTVGDDSDGSWEVFLGVTDVNGKTVSKSLRLRPFSQPEVGLLFDSSNIHAPNLYRIPDLESGAK